MANFKYEVKPEQYRNVAKLSTSAYDKFNSVCNETMVGVVYFPGDDSPTASCFFGFRPASIYEETDDELMEDENDQVSYF